MIWKSSAWTRLKILLKIGDILLDRSRLYLIPAPPWKMYRTCHNTFFGVVAVALHHKNPPDTECICHSGTEGSSK